MKTLLVARELLRAARGKRSQQAFSRRLGYASNVVAKWEAGRRMPTAAEALRVCERAGVDVRQALATFRASTAPRSGPLGDAEVAQWLNEQRGGQPISTLAARSGCSRYRVSRFLSGATRPRLPEFLGLVAALTGRLPELVALLVDIQRVPSLLRAYRQTLASRQAAFVQPWSSAVLALIATGHYRAPLARGAVEVAHALGITPEVALLSLQVLQESGVLSQRRGRLGVRSSLVVDTRGNPSGALALRDHWSRVSGARLQEQRASDLFSYNLFSVSRADFARMRELQQDFFQQMRLLAVASEPSEVAGLMVLHLVQWDPEASVGSA